MSEAADFTQAGAPSGASRKAWVFAETQGQMRADLSVPGMRCSACIAKIETAFAQRPGVDRARVNLSTKRVSIFYRQDQAAPEDFILLLAKLGFEARPFAGYEIEDLEERTERTNLYWCLAISGIATICVMALSMSLPSGASDMTRTLIHWISAAFVLPAAVYAGRPFYHSAWQALRNYQLNMDVPISLAVILSIGISLYETMVGGAQTYFDASVMLLFFLLIGRTLDHVMRAKARSAVAELVKLAPDQATQVLADGSRQTINVSAIEPGTLLSVAPGSRVPIDGEIISGTSDVDFSLVTGESVPKTLTKGDKALGGVMNLSGPLTVKATASPDNSFLSRVVHLMEAAEQGKAHYMRLATKAANIYAPTVHILAAATLIGWLYYTNGDWHQSIFIATSVLIITCPCALGLAVPVVQIVASGELFRRGIMVKDGAALEKLGEIDWVLFDKTGTLTLGEPRLLDFQNIAVGDLSLAAGLAQESNHPLSCAIVRAAIQRDIAPARFQQIQEVPGCGVEGVWQGRVVRLGKASWCEAEMPGGTATLDVLDKQSLVLAADGAALVQFSFEDQLRSDAADLVAALRDKGHTLEMLSGDGFEAVRRIGNETGIDAVHANLLPQEKLDYVKSLAQKGMHVLMVGDGLNDAPSLAAAHTSMAPSSASDIGRMSADFVFFGEKLSPVLDGLVIAKKARRLVHQNFALAALYNLIAVPIAVAGFATPLIAAIAMSSSSLFVTLNALRLRRAARPMRAQL